MSDLIIDDKLYLRIMSCIGYPIISDDDLGVDSDFIKDVLIYPAIVTYYKYFPKKNKQIYNISSTFSIPFPNTNVIGVVEARANNNLLGGDLRTLSPIINSLNINVSTMSGTRVFGTGNDYGMFQARLYKNMERQGTVEESRTFRIDVDENNRLIEGYLNMSGLLQVTWGEMSLDTSIIPYKRQEEVITLAKANVLQYFGEVRNQGSSQLPVEMTGEGLLERAREYREKIETIWNEFTKVVIMRGS